MGNNQLSTCEVRATGKQLAGKYLTLVDGTVKRVLNIDKDLTNEELSSVAKNKMACK